MAGGLRSPSRTVKHPIPKMSYSLDSLKGLYRGFYRGLLWPIEGDTKSLEYS